MVNTRAKMKKMQNTIEENTLKTQSFLKASVSDSDLQTTQSGALIGSKDELLTEILRWLPVTSVLRFKSVSKQLQSLLSDRRFTLLYDNVLKTPGLFVGNLYIPFDVENQNTPPFRSLDFYPDIHGLRIVQSCNGLLLCCSNGGKHRSRKYYVFNPTTKQFSVIPSGGRRTIYFMGLAFHQTYSVHYKVVCIRGTGKWNTDIRELYQVQIYSSATGKWKVLNQYISDSYYTFFKGGVYWNGAIHWTPSCPNPSYLNLNLEQLQTLPLPDEMEFKDFYYKGAVLYFGESRGHLHLVQTAYHETNLLVNVYEMLSDHSGWFLKYNVDLDELPAAYANIIHSFLYEANPEDYEFQVFDVVRGEKEEDTFMVLRVHKNIIRYNIHDKSFKHIFDLPDSFDGKPVDAHRYTVTLTSF